MFCETVSNQLFDVCLLTSYISLIAFKILYEYSVPFLKINHILTEYGRIKKSVPVGKLFGRHAIALFNSR